MNKIEKVVNILLGRVKEEVALATATLEDGTVVEADEFVAGQPIVIKSEEGEDLPAPAGEHILEGGETLVIVDENSVIVEVRDISQNEEEEAPAEENEEVEASEETAEEVVEETVEVEAEEATEEVEAEHEEGHEDGSEEEEAPAEEEEDEEEYVSKSEFMAALTQLQEEIELLKSGMNPVAEEEAYMSKEVSKVPASTPIKHNPDAVALSKTKPSGKMTTQERINYWKNK